VVIPPAVYREVVESAAETPGPARVATLSISTSVKARRFWSPKRSGTHLF
jgi:hypothetical protein